MNQYTPLPRAAAARNTRTHPHASQHARARTRASAQVMRNNQRAGRRGTSIRLPAHVLRALLASLAQSRRGDWTLQPGTDGDDDQSSSSGGSSGEVGEEEDEEEKAARATGAGRRAGRGHRGRVAGEEKLQQGSSAMAAAEMEAGGCGSAPEASAAARQLYAEVFHGSVSVSSGDEDPAEDSSSSGGPEAGYE